MCVEEEKEQSPASPGVGSTGASTEGRLMEKRREELRKDFWDLSCARAWPDPARHRPAGGPGYAGGLRGAPREAGQEGEWARVGGGGSLLSTL